MGKMQGNQINNDFRKKHIAKSTYLAANTIMLRSVYNKLK